MRACMGSVSINAVVGCVDDFSRAAVLMRCGKVLLEGMEHFQRPLETESKKERQ